MFGAFTRKTPKGQQIDKSPYTLYDSNIKTDFQWPDRIRVISIDPGTQNYCLRVEERPFKETNNDPIIPLLYDKIKLKRDDISLKENKSNLYQILTEYLDSNIEIFKTCHLVIVERQLPFNYKAT